MVSAWTLYTLGNGQFVSALLSGVSALVHSHAFTQLLILCFLFGFGGLLIIQVPVGRIEWVGMLRYILFTALFLRFVMGFDVDVGIVDILSGEGNRIVGRVPFFLAVPACALSQVGHQLAAQLDMAYSHYAGLPLDLTLSNGSQSANTAPLPPFNPIARLFDDAMRYRIVDAALARSLTYFFVDCLVPLVAQHRVTAQALWDSSDIWAYVGKWPQHPGLMTVYFSSGPGMQSGTVLSCPQAYTKLDELLKKYRTAPYRAGINRVLHHGASATLFQSVLNYTAQDQLYTPSAGAFLQQAALTDLLSHRVISLMAVRTQSSLLFKQLALLQQEKEVVSHWVMASHAFSSAFGYVFSGLQVMVYAMAPLVLIFAVFPGGRGKILLQYIKLLAWFPLTFVLLSMVSNVCASWVAQSLQSAWYVSEGLSLANKAMLSEKLHKFIEVGGWLVTLVPVFSWGLITSGQYALGAALRTAVSYQAVSRAAHSRTTGNMSLDEQHYHNTQANRFSTAMQTQLGAMPVGMHRQSSTFLEHAHLGGVYVTQNHLSAMREKKTWHEQRHTEMTDQQRHQGEEAHLQQHASLSHQAEAMATSSSSYATALQSKMVSGALGGAVSLALQHYFSSHIPHRVLGHSQRAYVESLLQHATVDSGLSAQATQSGEEAHAHRLFLQSSDYFQRAYQAVRSYFPNGEQGERAAIGVLGAGIAGAGMVALPEMGAVEAAGVGAGAMASRWGAQITGALGQLVLRGGKRATPSLLEAGLSLSSTALQGVKPGVKSGERSHMESKGLLHRVLGQVSGQVEREFIQSHKQDDSESYMGQWSRQSRRDLYMQSVRTRGLQNSDAVVHTAMEEEQSVPGQSYYAAQEGESGMPAHADEKSPRRREINREDSPSVAFLGEIASWEHQTQSWLQSQEKK